MTGQVYMPDSAESNVMRSAMATAGLTAEHMLYAARSTIGVMDNYIILAVFRDITLSPAPPVEIQAGTNYYVFTVQNSVKTYIQLSDIGTYILNTAGWYTDGSLTTQNPQQNVYMTYSLIDDEWQWRVGGGQYPQWWTIGNHAGDNTTDNIYILDSSLPLEYNGSPYTPSGADERILAKNVGEYTFNVGVAANEDSSHPAGEYIWSTRNYKINVHWTSQRTGTTFSKDLDNLIHNQAFFTYPPLFPNYCFSTASSVGMFAKAYRMPIGVYETVVDIPVDFEDCTAVRSVITMSLNELKAIAETQQAGVVNDDLFTEIFFDFIDSSNSQIIETKSLDYGSLFGRDIDLGGSTFPDPNDAEGLADDNKYTDHIDLTTPTLTATGVFNRCYVLDGNGVNDLCDYLYNADDNIFDEIVDGVLTRGSPIDSLIDLRLYPFDVRAFTGAGAPEFIKFGRTQTTVAASRLPHDANAVIDLGSCTVPREYNNFLDYQSTVQLYIPFCGMCELPMSKVLNHELSIKLIVDYITGAGTAVVFVDRIPLLFQQGIIGISIPMTATNSAEFGKTIAGNLIKTAADAVSGDYSGAAAGALDSAEAIWQGSKIQKAGASSPQTSLYQPKNAYLLLSLVNPAPKVWENEYADIAGYATFMPIAAIGDLSPGFTAFDNVKLNIPGATERERDMILQLLKEGIYI